MKSRLFQILLLLVVSLLAVMPALAQEQNDAPIKMFKSARDYRAWSECVAEYGIAAQECDGLTGNVLHDTPFSNWLLNEQWKGVVPGHFERWQAGFKLFKAVAAQLNDKGELRGYTWLEVRQMMDFALIGDPVLKLYLDDGLWFRTDANPSDWTKFEIQFSFSVDGVSSWAEYDVVSYMCGFGGPSWRPVWVAVRGTHKSGVKVIATWGNIPDGVDLSADALHAATFEALPLAQ